MAEMHIKVVCRTCNGRGWIDYEPEWDSHECATCEGYGYRYLKVEYNEGDLISASEYEED